MKSRVKEMKNIIKFLNMVSFSVFGNISVLRIISAIHIYLYIKKNGSDYSKSYLMEIIFGYLNFEMITAYLKNFSQYFSNTIGVEKKILDFLNRYKRENYIGVYSCQILNMREKYNK